MDGPIKRIRSTGTRANSTLPQDVATKLKEFCNQVRQSGRVPRRGPDPSKGGLLFFRGANGTDKLKAAEAVADELHLDIYRVDISAVMSKYIGETEKNLSKIFNRAEDKNWILFFDEADALFGKRTEISDAHDRYANQEVGYLLQRIEAYEGLVILATNLTHELDAAFTRRLRFVVEFPPTTSEKRSNLRRDAFPENRGSSEAPPKKNPFQGERKKREPPDDA